jgi:hypothetical protein
MTISPAWRLVLYNLMAALPIWVEFVRNSQDFTFRGLMNPALNSIYAMVVVTLAKTAPTNGDEPQDVNVVNKPGKPVPVSEQPPLANPVKPGK